MKTKLTTIMLLITLTGTAQSEYYLNFGLVRQNVKIQNRQLELIYSAPDYLEYKTESGYIAYEFKDRHCTASTICMDSIAATRFIAERIEKNWRLVSPDTYHYYPDNVDTIQIEADWFGGNVIFRYTLKD